MIRNYFTALFQPSCKFSSQSSAGEKEKLCLPDTGHVNVTMIGVVHI